MICLEQRKYVEFFRQSQKHRQLDLAYVDPALVVPHKKISLCTTCMNRLHDLQMTLPQNIFDNLDYDQLEFVLLDYSSEDGLEEWVKREMSVWIRQGVLNFYRANGHTRYLPSHSRNVTFRLATGDIVVNVDADNYIGEGFARRINQCMAMRKEHIIAVSERFLRPHSTRLLLKGRFALYRNDLLALGGFDEDLDDQGGYSNEDLHLVLRAMMLGYRIVRFESRFVNNRIETPEPARIKYMDVSGSYSAIKAINEKIIGEKIGRGIVFVNQNRIWGRDMLTKNFEQEVVSIGS